MSSSTSLSDNTGIVDISAPSRSMTAPASCALPISARDVPAVNSNLCKVLNDVGCPLAIPVEERLRFETFLAQLSATFVNVAADCVDAEIESALRQIVDFLGIDRCGFGEVTADGKQIAITHSFQLPGVPPSPRCIVDERLPWYARTIWQGNVVRLPRLPDDLPPEAIPERQYCEQTGLKSQLTIPLKVMGAVVGGIGFAAISAYHDWPDELVERLRLVGGIFTNALARKLADEALKLAEEHSRILRNELAHATRQELLNHLATSIAHEVNQPLCAIASNAQTALALLEMGDVEEVKNALQDMWSDARRGSEIIGRIRGMVRKQESGRSRICLGTMIKELLPLLAREGEAKGVAFQVDLQPDNLSAFADRVHLQQVMVNLVLNAIEAVTEGSVVPPTVVIRAWREDFDWTHVSVTDSGPGLAPEDCEKIFAPYFTTKRNGLGMGLSISRSLVESHGGSLWAKPGAERGTTFVFRIPAGLSQGT